MTRIVPIDDPELVRVEYAHPERQRARQHLLDCVGDGDLDAELDRLVLEGLYRDQASTDPQRTPCSSHN
jgi:hypothetical protein